MAKNPPVRTAPHALMVTGTHGEKRLIFAIRGHQVMLDTDAALLYGVTQQTLRRTVLKHVDRFPTKCMFQLTPQEWAMLKSELGSQLPKRRIPPYVFTELGTVMLAGVLKSPVATKISMQVVESFISMRCALPLAPSTDEKITLLRKDHETRLNQHDEKLDEIVELLQTMIAPERESSPIGFDTGLGD